MKVWILILILIIGILALLVHILAGVIILIALMVVILLSWREKSTDMPDPLEIEKIKRKRQMEEEQLLKRDNRRI